MGEYGNQALKTHAKKGKTKKEEHSHKKPKRFQKKDYSSFRCYSCDEMGHLTRDCPKGKGHAKK